MDKAICESGGEFPPPDGQAQRIVISCSRRCDVPRWHFGWLAASLRAGSASFHGVGGRARRVSLLPAAVHSLVLWSKDFRHFTGSEEVLRLLEPYSLYFHFTITGLGGTQVEPGVPPASEMLSQLEALASRWEPERINWRFDPIVFWREDGRLCSNLDLFSPLADSVAATGVTRCTFSFADWSYRKPAVRAVRRGFDYVDPPLETKLAAAGCLAQIAASSGLDLYSCAAPQWADVPGIRRAACIDGALLGRLHPHGEPALLGKDRGQRAHCGCTPSVDIGSYGRCPHACIYCYANPAL
ncbi:MAG: DUF1848 domain-containing protein [Chloroflexi bacterium]|nr:DUF1848 domain-containing protein [Chloroflexota bacterium]